MKLWEILKEENVWKKYRDNNGIKYELVLYSGIPTLKRVDDLYIYKFSQMEIMELIFEEIEEKKTGWERVNCDNPYYKIDIDGEVDDIYSEDLDCIDDRLYEILNYFSTEEKADEIAKEQLLYRKMKKFYDENDANVYWDDLEQCKYEINYDYDETKWEIYLCTSLKVINSIYFSTEELAQRCINEVIKPFYENNK